jgi:hypothetical protein
MANERKKCRVENSEQVTGKFGGFPLFSNPTGRQHSPVDGAYSRTDFTIAVVKSAACSSKIYE